ncbi:hypothetical protein [Malaciobacter mytili]|uniref:hypothetical protein n=1 Tax=Malaciobacter mytili TaxID=603050 RepID=UPI003A8B392D
MVIKSFIYAILLISTLIYFVPIANIQDKENKKEIPIVSFNNSTMYTLNEQTVTKIVNSKKASRFETKDIMYEGNFILKANDKKVKNATDYVSADVIIKQKEEFTFINNVKFRRDNFMTLNTQELFYNDKTKIARNTIYFSGTYYNHKLNGTNLYLDMNNEIMKSKNSHFEIDITKN